MVTSIKPWFNFFSSSLVQEAFLLTSFLCMGEIIANSESGSTGNELGLKTQYGLKESLEISVPQTDQFEKCFCWCSAWENQIELIIPTGRSWTRFEDSKRFVLMIWRKPWNISPPNRLVRKRFWLSAWSGENCIGLKIRIDREWTWFKGVKQFVLMTSSKLWNISLPKMLVQNTCLSTCLDRKTISSSASKQKGNGLGLKTSKSLFW